MPSSGSKNKPRDKPNGGGDKMRELWWVAFFSFLRCFIHNSADGGEISYETFGCVRTIRYYNRGDRSSPNLENVYIFRWNCDKYNDVTSVAPSRSVWQYHHPHHHHNDTALREMLTLYSLVRPVFFHRPLMVPSCSVIVLVTFALILIRITGQNLRCFEFWTNRMATRPQKRAVINSTFWEELASYFWHDTDRIGN